MISGLIAFLSGSVFRMLWGEAAAVITKWQDHRQEMARMALQGQHEAEQHARNIESIKLQASLGVQTIRVQAEADLSRLHAEVEKVEAEGWLEAVKASGRRVGVAFVDAWNAIIRPAVATWSVTMITLHYANVIKLDDNGWALCGSALGIYLADRALFKRGK